MTRIRLAVIGVGALGQHHARILSELESVELVAVVDQDRERGLVVADRVGTSYFRGHEAVYELVDAVSIAVPTSFHRDLAIDFLEREIPVLVEKPLAGNLDEARDIVLSAQCRKTLLQVGHVERFNPAVTKARSICGRPKYIRAERIGPFTFRSTDIGVVHDLMIHDLDLVLDLVDSPIVQVDAFGLALMSNKEDLANARLVFENGCIVDLVASRVSPEARRGMQIWSDTGLINVDFMNREVVRYRPSSELLHGISPVALAECPAVNLEQLKRDIFERYIQIDQPPVIPVDALTTELKQFVDCVQNGERPEVGGEEALQALVLADAVLMSMAMHRWEGDADGATGSEPHRRELHRLAG